MSPFVFDSCDFVQVPLKNGQTTYFFKTAGSLTGKKILSVSIPSLGFVTVGKAMIDPSQVYITLIDIEGNIIHNNTPAAVFSSGSLDVLPINRIIDWERSYIKIMDLYADSLASFSFFLNVYSARADYPLKPSVKKDNYYSIRLDYAADRVNHISFSNRLNALRNKKIKSVMIFGEPNIISGFITLYPYDRSRLIERWDISNLMIWNIPMSLSERINTEFDRRAIRSYFTPTEIDFDRSSIEIIPRKDSTQTAIFITFIYE